MKKNLFNIANILSLSRIFFGIAFLLLFILYKYLNLSPSILSLLVFIMAIITDGLDGYFARKNNKITDLGKHLDPLTDSIFFIIVFFTFYLLRLLPIYFFILIFLRELFMHVFLRPFLKSKGQSLPANTFGKMKTVVQSVVSITVLTFLILKQLLIILINLNENIIKIYDFYLNITAYVFFAITTFLSLLSLSIYLFQSKKNLIKTTN